MFANAFGMKFLPFQEQPSGRQILHDDRIERGLAKLAYFRDHGRIALLCGRTGIGKTCLVRAFLAAAEPRLFLPVHITTSRLGATALLKLITTALGEKPARGRERIFGQLADKALAIGKTVLLVVDDAHLPDPTALTDLRLLADTSHPDGTPLFRVLLSGFDELRCLLQQDRFTDIQERISVRTSLLPLSEGETTLYIQWHLTQAEARPDIFHPEAVRLLHDFCGGIPRRINHAARACIVLAATEKAKSIADTCVRRALAEPI